MSIVLLVSLAVWVVNANAIGWLNINYNDIKAIIKCHQIQINQFSLYMPSMFGGKTKGLSTSVIMTLLIVAVVGSSSNFTAQNVYAGKYSTNNDQASSQAINCSGNNQNCVNINPQA